MVRKKGQITLFVIFGALILALILAGVYYKSEISKLANENILNRRVALPAQTAKVQSHIQECVDDMSLRLLYQLGSQGGLLRVSEDKGVSNEDLSIAYGYYSGKNVLPSLEDFKKEFSGFMNAFLPQCLYTGVFEKVSITPSTPVTNLELFDTKVRVVVKYPVQAQEGESVYKLDEPYNVEYPLRIKFLHGLSEDIVKKTASDPKSVDVSYLLGLDVKADVFPYDAKTFVYSLEDDKSVVQNNTYRYNFAVR
ncbi:hypothetical protein FJZ53_02165 [Candidatus Woesearchaeota archaeon]|nr:hypothetical protein [Candidatus Woesearchaeota archaeon]